MKNLILLAIFTCISSYAEALDWDELVAIEYNTPFEESDPAKLAFKMRAPPISTKLINGLRIRANFKAPFVGNDLYFADVYFKLSDTEHMYYRDELTAHEKYDEEYTRKTFTAPPSKISEINSPSGLDIVKTGGVNLISTNFKVGVGGQLTLKIKAPKHDEIVMNLDVVFKNELIEKYIITSSGKVKFDQLNVNAAKSMILGTSILNGLKSIDFTLNGKKVHTIIPK